MGVNRISAGLTIPYTPSSAVAAGAVVVQGDLVGIAVHDLEANKLGNLDVDGHFEFDKATGGGTALTVGATVFWDATNSRVSATASVGKKAGVVTQAAATTDATVRVKLTPGQSGRPAAVVAATGLTPGASYSQADQTTLVGRVDSILAALKSAGLMASA
jgi:predicted RecA/RadA family phage recombinase